MTQNLDFVGFVSFVAALPPSSSSLRLIGRLPWWRRRDVAVDCSSAGPSRAAAAVKPGAIGRLSPPTSLVSRRSAATLPHPLASPHRLQRQIVSSSHCSNNGFSTSPCYKHIKHPRVLSLITEYKHQQTPQALVCSEINDYI